MQESAFENPPWLLEREGAGYVQVTELLFRIAERCTGSNTVEDIAAAISAAGKPVSPTTVRTLVAQLLIPRGLVDMADGSVVPVAAGAASPLGLNMRMKMFGPETIEPITRILKPLYWPPLLIVMLIVAACAEVWLYFIHGIGAGLHDAIYVPGLMVIVLLAVIVSAGFHELGHAAALHYAGGKIKAMGAGIYVVYPAFFTDVSDNYRLPRWQRVRTDLGGFYFNLIFALAILGVYALTGHEFLLLMILMINLEIIHQLVPFLRLDGYWTLADITGVPDFFSQMAAFVRTVVPIQAWQGRKLPPLKWWAKVVFAVYTLLTIPLLIMLLVLMVRGAPRVLATAWDALGQQAQAFGEAQGRGDVLVLIGSVLQALLLIIPTAGLAYTLFAFGRRFCLIVWKWGEPTAARRVMSAACLVGAAGLVGFMWVPGVPLPGRTPESPPLASWQPIGPDERGTVQDVVAPAPAAAPFATPAEVQRDATVEPVATAAATITSATPKTTSEATPGETPGVTPAPTAVTPGAAATGTPGVRGTQTPGATLTALRTGTPATPVPRLTPTPRG